MIESSGSPPFHRETHPVLEMDGRIPRCGTMNAPNSPVYCVPSETHSVSGPPTLTCRVIARSPHGRRRAVNLAIHPRGRTHTQAYLIYYRRDKCNSFSDSLHAVVYPPLGSTHVPLIPGHNASICARSAVAHRPGTRGGEEYGWFPHVVHGPRLKPHAIRACTITILPLSSGIFNCQSSSFPDYGLFFRTFNRRWDTLGPCRPGAPLPAE